jgi:hypothetical protein
MRPHECRGGQPLAKQIRQEREQRILQHGDRQTEQIEHAYLPDPFCGLRMIPRKGSPRIDRHYLTSIRAVASPYGLLAFTLRIPVSQGLMMAIASP